jgi:hypothetical protein
LTVRVVLPLALDNEMVSPLSSHEFKQNELTQALEFLKRARWELRETRKVWVWKDRFQVFDVNGDYLEITGVGYPDPDVIPMLWAVNAAFDPQTIHDPLPVDYKEFFTGRRDAWAANRAM